MYLSSVLPAGARIRVPPLATTQARSPAPMWRSCHFGRRRRMLVGPRQRGHRRPIVAAPGVESPEAPRRAVGRQTPPQVFARWPNAPSPSRVETHLGQRVDERTQTVNLTPVKEFASTTTRLVLPARLRYAAARVRRLSAPSRSKGAHEKNVGECHAAGRAACRAG